MSVQKRYISIQVFSIYEMDNDSSFSIFFVSATDLIMLALFSFAGHLAM
jgi:hypothetical protein